MRKKFNCPIVISVGAKPCRKCPLGKPRNKWDNNIRLELKEMGFDGVMWLKLTQSHANLPSLISSA
jgi:hypothetical protein